MPTELENISLPEGAALLQPRADAEAAEQERRAALGELGIDCDDWAPAEVKAPDIVPPQHRMRTAKSGNKKTMILPPRTEASAVQEENAAPPTSDVKQNVPAQRDIKEQPEAKRRRQRAKVTDEENVRLPLQEI